MADSTFEAVGSSPSGESPSLQDSLREGSGRPSSASMRRIFQICVADPGQTLPGAPARWRRTGASWHRRQIQTVAARSRGTVLATDFRVAAWSQGQPGSRTPLNGRALPGEPRATLPPSRIRWARRCYFSHGTTSVSRVSLLKYQPRCPTTFNTIKSASQVETSTKYC